MKKIYSVAAVILAVCSFITVFSACKGQNADKNATIDFSASSVTATAEASTDIDGTEYSLGADGYKYVITKASVAESTTTKQYLSNEAVTSITYVKGDKSDNKTEVLGISDSTESIKTTVSDETVKNESKGISILTKTSPVSKGNSASIIIIAEPNKQYTIDFYKTSNTLSTASGLATATSNSEGIASWTFEIEPDCESGNRKIIIKEKGSDNFVQTSITIE